MFGCDATGSPVTEYVLSKGNKERNEVREKKVLISHCVDCDLPSHYYTSGDLFSSADWHSYFGLKAEMSYLWPSMSMLEQSYGTVGAGSALARARSTSKNAAAEKRVPVMMKCEDEDGEERGDCVFPWRNQKEMSMAL